MHRAFEKVTPAGQTGPWLGANFWSRRGGPRMWTEYDHDVVAAELRVLHDHGLNVTRSFLYWPDLHPSPDVIDDALFARVEDFLDLHVELGMRSIPTFIVGHMSGQNWDPAWRGDRDPYADVWLVSRQAWFAGQSVKRLTAHPAIAGWLLSNEMPLYGRPPHLRLAPAPQEHVTAWVQLLTTAVRAAGGDQPLSTGDGAWGVEMTGVDNGFSVRAIAPHVDFLGPHVYRMETDVVRQHLAAAFVCELAGFAGLPVVLEEFGVTTDFVSAENAGHYYRQTLHNSLLAGATGWLAWNNTDYDDLFDQEPYSHHPFEMHFGITDRTGVPKTPLLELRDFREVLDDIDLAGCFRPGADTAVLVPAYVEIAFPFTQPSDRTAPIEALRQAHVAAREADLPIVFVREVDGLPADARLIVAPSTKQLTAPTWQRISALVHAGSTFYLSYFAGDHSIQRGPWLADLDGMFGVRQRLAYGLADPIVTDVVTITFVEAFGGIGVSEKLTFRVGGTTDARSFLPVEATTGTVVAVDDAGRPAIVVNTLGAGRAVLSTYPLEHLAAAVPDVNPEPTHRIYAALAESAGIVRDVRVDDPAVHVGQLHHHDGRRFVWLVSQSADPLLVKPQLTEGLTLTDRRGGPALTDVTLPPYGVTVLCLGGAT